MREIDDPKLGDLPPSAKLVFVVLSEEGTLTQKQLVEETRLSGRTVRYALERLREINALEEELSFRDARQLMYTAIHPSSSGETS